jgi:hypothetical protein
MEGTFEMKLDPEGAICHSSSRERRAVVFNAALRALTEETVAFPCIVR